MENDVDAEGLSDRLTVVVSLGESVRTSETDADFCSCENESDGDAECVLDDCSSESVTESVGEADCSFVAVPKERDTLAVMDADGDELGLNDRDCICELLCEAEREKDHDNFDKVMGHDRECDIVF